MGYPIGSGSEVLKRTTINGQTDTATSFRWDGTMATTGTSSYTVTALHIITILNVTFAETAGAAESIYMYGYDGANNIYFMKSQDIPANGTFVYDNRICLYGGDKLVVTCTTGTANIDIWCNYIDQDWS